MKRLRCRGVAAIEAALVMAGLAPLLALAINMGQLAIDGAAADRAASNAARYLSLVPLEALRDGSRLTMAQESARRLVDETLSASRINLQASHIEFMCGLGHCDEMQPGFIPTKIGVVLTVQSQSVFDMGDSPMNLTVYAEVGRDN